MNRQIHEIIKLLFNPMFEQLAASCLSRQASLNLFESPLGSRMESLLDHERIGGFYPTLSEIKQIKLLEQACEKASNGNELTCLIIHDVF